MTGPALRRIGGEGQERDAVTRRREFEAEHPDVVILPPSPDRWRAVAEGQVIGSYELDDLLDQLHEIYRTRGGTIGLESVPARHQVPE